MKHFKSTKKINNLKGIQESLLDYNNYKALLNQEKMGIMINKYLIVAIKFINLCIKYLMFKRKKQKQMKLIDLKVTNKVC